MKEQAFENVWDALEDNQRDAERMKLRSELMIAVCAYLSNHKGTQQEKADWLGITQPRLNDLIKGKINKFSLEALVDIAIAAGMRVSMQVEAA